MAAPIVIGERACPAAPDPGLPVFVLCNGRSGSTLLRFILDAHPDLACPPETNLPQMALQLATVWSLIEGAPLASERGDEPPAIPDAAIRGVRRTMDEMTGSYLARRRKKRYCDKSLGTARFAELLLRLYPEARFLCLYRHPMDVIASAMEACPWGLNGYGFDPYIAGTPGNAVFALARFWIDNVSTIHSVQEQFPASCHLVRYEDLVADPEAVAGEIFDFVGVPRAPGISARCFTGERERFGPGDYKIWHTSQVRQGSVGRGWSVPAELIPPPVLAHLNELADKLGYLQVDEEWGTASIPADLRAGERGQQSRLAATTRLPEAEFLAARLVQCTATLDRHFAERWGRSAAETFGVLAMAPAGVPASEARWRVDMGGRTVADVSGRPAAGDDTSWDVVGSIDAWTAVLTGRTNLGVALRRCQLRYCEGAESDPVTADVRIGMLAEFLGLRDLSQSSIATAALAAS